MDLEMNIQDSVPAPFPLSKIHLFADCLYTDLSPSQGYQLIFFYTQVVTNSKMQLTITILFLNLGKT